MKEKAKWKQFLDKYVPRWAVLPLLTILAANCLIYWGSDLLTANRHHFDFTMGFDRAVPLVPFFVWFYILAFPFWAIGYLLSARRGKKTFYRFVATDLTIHLICFILFLVIPTTNIRPELTDGTISEKILGIVYAMDGGVHPSNLFPSIHCYVSWMCYRGLKGAREIPVWYQRFSFVFASLIIVSTQVLKQHYIVDAVAGVALVEIFWRFYGKKQRYQKLMGFFEVLNHKIWKGEGNLDEVESFYH